MVSSAYLRLLIFQLRGILKALKVCLLEKKKGCNKLSIRFIISGKVQQIKCKRSRRKEVIKVRVEINLRPLKPSQNEENQCIGWLLLHFNELPQKLMFKQPPLT